MQRRAGPEPETRERRAAGILIRLRIEMPEVFKDRLARRQQAHVLIQHHERHERAHLPREGRERRGDHPQQGRLARPIGACQRDPFRAAYFEGQVTQHRRGGIIAGRDAAQRQHDLACRQAGRGQADLHRLQDFDSLPRGLCGGFRFGDLAFGKVLQVAARDLRPALHRADQDARRAAPCRLALSGGVLPGFLFGGELHFLARRVHLAFGLRQVLPRGLQFECLAGPIGAPSPAITGRAQRRQLHDGIHAFEQLAVMADNQSAAAPAGEQARHRRAPVAVEIVGRLIQQQEIRLREDHRGERRARALPAREGIERRLRRGVQPGPAERFGEARLQRPVRRLPGIRLARFGAAQIRQRRTDLEQAGNRLAVFAGETLAQHAELAAHGNFTGGRRQASADEVQERGFADAVLADKSDAFLIETEIQV